MLTWLWVAAAYLLLVPQARASASTPAASPPDDPRAWLARTDQALATRNYRGVFVHEFHGETETLRVVHRFDSEGGLAERLQSMDGSGREFIRRGNQLICYLPDRRTVLVEKSAEGGLLLDGLPGLQAAMAGQYTVQQLARTRVSGRMTRLIAIVPMDQFRYSYRAWIDEATAMPLKMQLRDAHGHVLEQIVFTSLVLPAHIGASELAPSVDARNYRWVVRQDVAAARAPGLSVSWEAGALPPGFQMTASTRQMLPGGPAEHLVFTDGLASVSVFVQPASGDGAGDGAATLGTSSAYSRVVQGYRITVVGEVPPATVRNIALAIRGAGPAPGMAESFSSLGVPTLMRAGGAAVRAPSGGLSVPLLLPQIGHGMDGLGSSGAAGLGIGSLGASLPAGPRRH